MKISKLFHWLYAILMLLPAFFVGGRMAYTIFNKNAKDSYSDFNEQDNRYISLSDFDDLVVGNTYRFISNNNSNNLKTSSAGVMVVDNVEVINTNLDLSSVTITRFSVYSYQNSLNYIRINNSTNYDFRYNFLEFSFTYLGLENVDNFNTYEYYFDNMIYQYHISNNTNTLDNAFDYSMSQLNELPLFSWAKDSFIVEPFTYITGLFGMPSDSPVLTLLSYWCSISLIWLTFDLLMYVPLLVHRWLDKGVLE